MKMLSSAPIASVLNLIVRVVKERHERQRRIERRRVLEQAYGPQSSVAVWTLEIRDRRIRADLRMDSERRGQQRQGGVKNEMSQPALPARGVGVGPPLGEHRPQIASGV